MSGLSDSDWTRLETRFAELREELKGNESNIHKLDVRVNNLEVGKVHNCAEAIGKHEEKSWAHNPYKATGLVAGVIGAIESLRKFFHS